MGLYSGGGAYIWNEVSVSTCGGLIHGGAYIRGGGLIVGGLRYLIICTNLPKVHEEDTVILNGFFSSTIG